MANKSTYIGHIVSTYISYQWEISKRKSISLTDVVGVKRCGEGTESEEVIPLMKGWHTGTGGLATGHFARNCLYICILDERAPSAAPQTDACNHLEHMVSSTLGRGCSSWRFGLVLGNLLASKVGTDIAIQYLYELASSGIRVIRTATVNAQYTGGIATGRSSIASDAGKAPRGY